MLITMMANNIKSQLVVISFIAILHSQPEQLLIAGHGRLLNPAGRSTAWRFNYPNPINYNDNELFCGGYTVQWQRNKGKCGVCGDRYDGPRPNELPNGKYAKNLIITGQYQTGSVLTALIEITAYHRGYFEFRLCPTVDDHKEVTQDCLDANLLTVDNTNGQVRYYPRGGGKIKIKLQLPKKLVSQRCVLQWTYTAGNNWGKCDNQTWTNGCGPQETFRACADISISDSKIDEKKEHDLKPKTNNRRPVTPTTSVWSTRNNFPVSKKPTRTTATTTIRPFERQISTIKPTVAINTSKRSIHCYPTPVYSRIPNMAQWCTHMCTNSINRFCPQSHCICKQRHYRTVRIVPRF